MSKPIPELNWTDLTGQRVEITNGAWRGERGTITGFVTANGAWKIRLESGLNLAWWESEFKIID